MKKGKGNRKGSSAWVMALTKDTADLMGSGTPCSIFLTWAMACKCEFFRDRVSMFVSKTHGPLGLMTCFRLPLNACRLGKDNEIGLQPVYFTFEV